MISIEIRIDEMLFKRIGSFLISPMALAFIAIVGLAIPIALAAPVDVEFSFSANTPARASEVNANFTAMEAGVNDNDERIAAMETLNPLPSAGQVLAYLTTNASGNTVASYSSKGAATLAVQGTNYTVTLDAVICADGDGDPVGSATVSAREGINNSVACKIRDMTQNGDNCEIEVRCRNPNLQVNPIVNSAWNLIYIQ